MMCWGDRAVRAAMCALGVVVGLVPVAGCSGYTDLPLPERERGQLEIVAFDATALGPSTASVVIDLPDDAAGPFVVVGHPLSEVEGYRVVSWAHGPCGDHVQPGNPQGDPLRLCVAIAATGESDPGPLALTLVVESRADARRFTASGAEVR